MAKDPAVLFYTSDFLTGTAFFTDAERGQYIRLLCEQHQIGHIPENHMVSVCLSLGSPVLKKFAQDESGLYYNIRMEEEIIKRREFAESRRENGLKGGRPKSNKKPSGKPSGKPIAKPTRNLPENENENENYNSSLEKFEKPFLKTWRDSFEIYRSGLMEVYQKLLIDSQFISERQKYHPNLDIALSLEKSVNDFWGIEAGWKHKKKSKGDSIDWRLTLTKALDLPSNKVYINHNHGTNRQHNGQDEPRDYDKDGKFLKAARIET